MAYLIHTDLQYLGNSLDVNAWDKIGSMLSSASCTRSEAARIVKPVIISTDELFGSMVMVEESQHLYGHGFQVNDPYQKPSIIVL